MTSKTPSSSLKVGLSILLFPWPSLCLFGPLIVYSWERRGSLPLTDLMEVLLGVFGSTPLSSKALFLQGGRGRPWKPVRVECKIHDHHHQDAEKGQPPFVVGCWSFTPVAQQWGLQGPGQLPSQGIKPHQLIWWLLKRTPNHGGSLGRGTMVPPQ